MENNSCQCSSARELKKFTSNLARKKWPRLKEQELRKIAAKVVDNAVRILTEQDLKKNRRNTISTATVPLKQDAVRKFIARHFEELAAGTYSKRDLTLAQVYAPAKKNLSDEQKFALEKDNGLHFALFDGERSRKAAKVDSFRLLQSIPEVEELTQKAQIDSLIRRLSGVGIKEERKVKTDDDKLWQVRNQKRQIDALVGSYYYTEDSAFRELQELSARFQDMQRQIERIRTMIKR